MHEYGSAMNGSQIGSFMNFTQKFGFSDCKTLMMKAYDAFPVGGAFVAIENVIDTDRKTNV